MNRVLRVREWDRIRIGNEWAPRQVPPSIPESFANRLERHQRLMRIDAFDIGRYEVRAKNYVGTISVAGRSIDILPKIDDLSEMAVRARLVEMLGVARLLPNLEAGLAELDTSDASLLDYYMAIYVRHLRTEWRRGRIRGFRREEANRTALKGKLLISENLRHNLLHPERFYTRTDRFTEDVSASRFLKAALRVVAQSCQRESLRRDAQSLLSEFDDVGEATPEERRLQDLALGRQHTRYGPVIQLARLILSTESPDAVGRNKTYTLLFDMNRVFEGYIAELLRRHVCPALGLRAEAQLSGHYLLREDNGKKCFRLLPDVGIFEDKELTLLIDTKWKRLDQSRSDDGVSQSDVYQAYAYGVEYGVETVILLYPCTSTTNLAIRRYQHSSKPSKHILIGTVSMGGSAQTVAPELKAELNAIM